MKLLCINIGRIELSRLIGFMRRYMYVRECKEEEEELFFMNKTNAPELN